MDGRMPWLTKPREHTLDVPCGPGPTSSFDGSI